AIAAAIKAKAEEAVREREKAKLDEQRRRDEEARRLAEAERKREQDRADNARRAEQASTQRSSGASNPSSQVPRRTERVEVWNCGNCNLAFRTRPHVGAKCPNCGTVWMRVTDEDGRTIETFWTHSGQIIILIIRLLFGIGWLLSLAVFSVGQILLIVEGFRKELAWGLALCIVPFAWLVFCLRYYEENLLAIRLTMTSLLTGIFCFAVALIFLLICD
ncbi:MAG: hypothetical protein ACOY3P_07630, partial [Planctomycetota bacterium]